MSTISQIQVPMQIGDADICKKPVCGVVAPANADARDPNQGPVF